MGEIRPKRCEGRELTKDQLEGSALSMMVDVLGGVLSGTGPSAGVPQERRPYFNNGTFFLCIDPTVFRQMDDFLDDIELMKGAHQTLLIDTRSQTPPCAAASPSLLLQALDTGLDLSRTCTTLSGWSSLCLRGR
eukprot:COSAG04_NODE_3721_length_2584_cov_1.497787_3_plen_134_part_00